VRGSTKLAGGKSIALAGTQEASMRPGSIVRVLVLAGPIVGLGACGGGSGDDFLTGQASALQIQGSVDGARIDLTEPASGGGVTQLDTGEFDYGAPFAPVATGTSIKLTWPNGLVNGQTGPASGMFTLGSGPSAGQAFCVGQGSIVRIEDAGFQFNLTGLKSGSACDQTHAGTLRGWFAFE
jgi:hypothetical protein